MTYPSGKVADYTFDDRHQLKTILWQNSQIESRTYDDVGQLTNVTRPFVNETRAYNAAGRMTEIDSPVSKMTYGYDPNGNVTSETLNNVMVNYSFTTVSGGNIGYDGEDRFMRYIRSGVSEDIQLTRSHIGNITNVNRNGSNTARGYNNAHGLTTVSGGVTQTYDLDGNTTKLNTNVTASWDDAGRTMNTNTPTGATAGVAGFNEYGYVGGTRVWKKITRGGSTFEHRVYVHAGPNLIAEYNAGVAANTPVQEYVYADQIDSLVLIHRSDNQKLGVTRNRQWSVVALHDLANGNVVERYAYDMTGKRTIYAANGTTVRTTSSYGNHLGYTNRWHDENSGLINFRARHYNPLTGEFLSRDPLEFVDGMSLYRGYFGIDGVDPDGLDRKFPSGKHITGKGHHIIPYCFWGKFGFCEEAMEIFDGHCITCDKHNMSGHGPTGYNGHVQDVLTKYLKDHKLAGAQLTIEEQKALAEKLVEHVKTSNNKYIKGYLKHVECQDDLVDWLDGPGKKCVPPTGCEIKPLGKIKKICIPKVTKFCRKIPGVKYLTLFWITWLWTTDYNNARADDYSPLEATAIATARAADPGVEAACEGGFYVVDALSPFHDRPEIRRQQMAFPGAAEQRAMREAILDEDLRIQMGMQPSWECPMPAPPPVMGMPPFR